MNKKLLKVITISLYILIALSLADFFLKQITFFKNFINYPYVIEYRDAATVDITQLISKGQNPFTFKFALPHQYIYGLVYPIFSVVVFKFISYVDLYSTQKLISLFFIFLASSLTGFELYKRTKNTMLTLLGSAIPFSTMFPNARPESMGIAIYILFLIIAQYEIDSLIYIIFIALMASSLFFIKQYFAIGAITILIYYLFKSKKSLLIYSLSLIIIFTAEFSIVNSIFPLYFPSAIVNQFNAVYYNIPFMLKQSGIFISTYYPLIIIFIIVILRNIRTFVKMKIDLRNFNKPLLVLPKKHSVDIFFIATIVSIIVLTFLLGQNQGAFITYYIQLLPVTLAIFSLTFLVRLFGKTILSKLILTIGIMLVIFTVINNNQLFFFANILPSKSDQQDWNRAIMLIKNNKPSSAYLSPPLSLVALKLGWPVYDNGQTEFFIWSKSNNKLFTYFMPSLSKINQYQQKWEKDIDNKVINKEFSLIVVTKNLHPEIKEALLNKYYKLEKTLKFNIGHPTINETEFYLPNK